MHFELQKITQEAKLHKIPNIFCGVQVLYSDHICLFLSVWGKVVDLCGSHPPHLRDSNDDVYTVRFMRGLNPLVSNQITAL